MRALFEDIINSTNAITDKIQKIGSIMNDIDKEKEKAVDSTNAMKIIAETAAANTEEVLASVEEQTAGAQNLEEHSIRE